MVNLVIEGGGPRNLDINLRKAFRQFLEKAALDKKVSNIFFAGSRQEVFKRFEQDMAEKKTVWILVDSEGEVAVDSPWQHLKNSPNDKWEKPRSAKDHHAHLMVQCMESWFLADTKALKDHFGKGFKSKAIPKTSVENIDKNAIPSLLSRSAQNTVKEKYEKSRDSHAILALIDPEKVKNASPWAKRFLDTLGRET